MPALLELKWMLIPFLACLVLSINHVYLGIHVIARKVIFVDLALAQIAALGATYALTLGFDPMGDSIQVSLFSLAFTFVGAIAFSIARMRKEKVPQEAFIGIIYAAASAGAILILSKSATGGEELKHMLVGDLLLVSMSAVKIMALLYGSIGLFHVIFRRQFLAISLDPEGAEARGINIRFWDVLFYMSFGVVIVKSVAIVGVLLVFSYLVVPAVIAQMWRESVRGKLLAGWLIAILASTLGILWSFHSDYPTGPAIVVTLGIFLVLSGIIYYLRHAQVKFKALVNVAILAAFAIGFFSSLSYFKKQEAGTTLAQLAPVDQFLNGLKQEAESNRLDAISHLGDLHDPRIVPALTDLLLHTQSEQLIEAIVEALTKQQDPRALSALRHADEANFDDFMKLSIAKAELTLGDVEGFDTLIVILKDAEAAFARQQANELLESKSGRNFGYKPDLTVNQNHLALQKIQEWWRQEGQHLQWDSRAKKFKI
jgi:zinc/manganese transport system permease protein